MKKVGILTFHRAINLGAALQCYCLYKTLEFNGYAPVIIDYRPDYIEFYREYFSLYQLKQINTFSGKIRYLISLFVKFNQKKNNRRVFDSFYEGISFNPVIDTEILDVNKFHAILVGSDQVWCPRITNGLDKFFWGNFKHEGVKLISYAASLGIINSQIKDRQQEIKQSLNNFDAISVREEYAADYLTSLLNNKIVNVVADPTLLAPKAVLDEIAIEPIEKDYVLFYALNEKEGMLSFAESIANQLNCKLLKVKPFKTYGAKSRNDAKYEISPSQFCGYIKYAKCVVCSSFHGTIISTIFNKDFYSFKTGVLDRAEAYLNLIGLPNRSVGHMEKILFTSVDYTNINKNIDDFRNRSLDFLLTNLEKAI